jgi:hypothetical protein
VDLTAARLNRLTAVRSKIITNTWVGAELNNARFLMTELTENSFEQAEVSAESECVLSVLNDNRSAPYAAASVVAPEGQTLCSGNCFEGSLPYYFNAADLPRSLVTQDDIAGRLRALFQLIFSSQSYWGTPEVGGVIAISFEYRIEEQMDRATIPIKLITTKIPVRDSWVSDDCTVSDSLPCQITQVFSDWSASTDRPSNLAQARYIMTLKAHRLTQDGVLARPFILGIELISFES